ncbi:hypothetical protein [Amycolatopsis sp. 195334CR]|uniref:hypothetical protein n=1 Tax=Amycolatopsis sp. 195334CR TaxID=2814588 RepID=UPI001A90BE4F|nr:hypothetical protein [Amycolatopsis sp. 195334CR]MBN6034757.1 hypothetical protein [Amycolatopsis sp. 195334CR]
MPPVRRSRRHGEVGGTAKSAAALALVRQNLPDLFPDAPSLTALHATAPPLPGRGGQAAVPPPLAPKARPRARVEEPGDEPIGSIMRRGYE